MVIGVVAPRCITLLGILLQLFAVADAMVEGAAVNYITLHYITSHHITLHYITLHYIILYYIISYYIILQQKLHNCVAGVLGRITKSLEIRGASKRHIKKCGSQVKSWVS